jgi:uncharacterized protein (DUF2249 family)
MAKEAFNKRKELLTNTIIYNLKKKILKSFVWSEALYGSETWTIKKKELRKFKSI